MKRDDSKLRLAIVRRDPVADASPQARHHFTRFDQVDRLCSVSEAVPDLAYMGRQLTLCCLLRTNPGDKSQYLRQNGPYQLGMSAEPVSGNHHAVSGFGVAHEHGFRPLGCRDEGQSRHADRGSPQKGNCGGRVSGLPAPRKLHAASAASERILI